MKRKPKILLWDIETGYNQLLGFDLGGKFGTGIPYKNVQKERYIISAAWKWLGQSRIHMDSLVNYPGFENDPHDDEGIVGHLIEVIDEADAIVAHYGDEFDWKYFMSRVLINDYLPPKPPIQIDTWKMARKKFRLNSYRLDYICKATGGPRKHNNEWEWWLGAWEGKASDVKKIAKYNKQDIECLEWVYNKLAPYDQSKVNHRLYMGGPVCRNCGSTHVQFRGEYTTTKEGIKKRIQCQKCGAWDAITMTALKKQFPGVEF